MKHLLIAFVALMSVVTLSAQNYRRPTPTRPQRQIITPIERPQFDTVAQPPRDSLQITGFDKQLRSKRETMFVTNSTSRQIHSIALKIDYYDMQDYMLHSATHSACLDIPAGETRQLEVPSFDRTDRFYYHESPVPTRAQQATPFKVKITVLYITHPFTPTEQ